MPRASTRRPFPCSRRSSRADPAQPRRDAAAGDGALRARARGAGARGLRARPRSIAPDSQDVRTYLGLHYARGHGLGAGRAAPRAGRRRVARSAARRSRRWRSSASGRAGSPTRSRCASRIYALRTPTPRELVRLGRAGDGRRRRRTLAIAAFEARPGAARAARSAHDLELGVLYLAARRLPRRGTRSTACRRRTPTTRWRSSSGRRSACSCTSPIRPRGSPRARRQADATTRDAHRARAPVSSGPGSASSKHEGPGGIGRAPASCQGCRQNWNRAAICSRRGSK